MYYLGISLAFGSGLILGGAAYREYVLRYLRNEICARLDAIHAAHNDEISALLESGAVVIREVPAGDDAVGSPMAWVDPTNKRGS